jgi:hypothetical protein
MPREGVDPLLERLDHPLGAMPVLQPSQQHIARLALDQRRDRGLVISAHQQIALPMLGSARPVRRLPASCRRNSPRDCTYNER